MKTEEEKKSIIAVISMQYALKSTLDWLEKMSGELELACATVRAGLKKAEDLLEKRDDVSG